MSQLHVQRGLFSNDVHDFVHDLKLEACRSGMNNLKTIIRGKKITVFQITLNRSVLQYGATQDEVLSQKTYLSFYRSQN